MNSQLSSSDEVDTSASSITRAFAKAELLQVVDTETMATFLDPQRDLKAYVYDVFKQTPALLAPTIEGLSKAEHRELVRKSLRTLLAAGFSPLQYFDSDIKKYIYMAEVCAPIDLSLVRSLQSSFTVFCELRQTISNRRLVTSCSMPAIGILTWTQCQCQRCC